MFASRTGIGPIIISCALAACVSGCASTHHNTQVYGYYDAGASAQRKVAQAGVVMEDDGLPSQSPPPAHIRALPDEPGEPFSKNYGGSNPAATRSFPAVRESAEATDRARPAARAGDANAALLPWAARTVSYAYRDE